MNLSTPTSSMLKRIALTGVSLVLLTGTVHSQSILDFQSGAEAEGERIERAYSGSTQFNLPARPPSMILDDLEVIPEATRNNLSAQLLDAAKNHRVHLFIVILPTTGGEDLPRAGQKILGQWQQPGINAIIFGTPQSLRDNNFYMIAATKELPAEARPVLDDAIRHARAATGREHESAAQILVGAETFLDRLTTISKRMDDIIMNPAQFTKKREIVDHTPLARLKQFKQSKFPWLRLWHLFALLGAATILPTLAWLAHKKRAQKPLVFPEFEARVRLGAPASGGNNSLADFRRRSRGG